MCLFVLNVSPFHSDHLFLPAFSTNSYKETTKKKGFWKVEELHNMTEAH